MVGLALIASLLSTWLGVSTAQNLRRLAKFLCRAPPPSGSRLPRIDPRIGARRANHFVFSEMACPAPFTKIFLFRPEANQFTDSHRPVPLEGRIARRHERGAGCGGRESVRRAMAVAGRDEPRERSASVQDDRRLSGRQSRVVLTPVAGAKLAEAKSSPTGFDEPLIRQ